MQKTILLTGSTDGIGLETAKMLVTMGHHVLLHGRNPDKLNKVESLLSALPGGGITERYVADLSNLADVTHMADAVIKNHKRLDVLINNAGIFSTSTPTTPDGMDVRFVVNTLAPYLLTKKLLPLLDASGRVVNLSSAAQAPVNLNALTGKEKLEDWGAYSQSKLAITMWSRHLAHVLKDKGPSVIAINPGSMLATNMVKKAFGVDGNDVRIGARILCDAALTDEFANATGQYFDNDSGRFAPPHPDALNPQKTEEVVNVIESLLTD